MEALLNPQVEAAACKRMIAVVEERKQQVDLALTTSVLDRETYLLKIGASKELFQVLTIMKREYEREFNI